MITQQILGTDPQTLKKIETVVIAVFRKLVTLTVSQSLFLLFVNLIECLGGMSVGQQAVISQ